VENNIDDYCFRAIVYTPNRTAIKTKLDLKWFADFRIPGLLLAIIKLCDYQITPLKAACKIRASLNTADTIIVTELQKELKPSQETNLR
jgi:hypothetical protein